MTYEGFAVHLGVSPRQVFNWHGRPRIVPQAYFQRKLDRALENASDEDKARFTYLIEHSEESVMTPDEQDRVKGVALNPSRLDAATVENLARVLAGQRHAEDALGSEALVVPMTSQLETLIKILRETPEGRHRQPLSRLVAEWTSFVGWLNASVRNDAEAERLFSDAEEMADEIRDGTIAATAISFRGYLALLQDRFPKAIRESAAALATPGSHSTQHTYDLLQTAQSYAKLGDQKTARVFLDQASNNANSGGEPPSSVYWYTEPFFRLNIGLAQADIGQYREAAESLRSGIEEIPPDQRGAEWMTPYRQALVHAEEQA
jgi:tetratricopeptide (TPR) repeat protein